MPASNVRPKKRYITFKVDASRDISRGEFIAAINNKASEKDEWRSANPWLTVFENNLGILRCAHTSKEDAITLLSSIKTVGRGGTQVRVETLGTSGTIKKAKMSLYKNLKQ